MLDKVNFTSVVTVKNASAATLALLSGGQYLVGQCYEITLSTGQIYYFTDFQTALNNVMVYLPLGTTAGPFNFGTGLTIDRDTITQAAGVKAGNMRLKITPQWDSPNAPILINGYPLLQAVRLGFFDSATIRMSKIFLAYPAAGAQLDTSPGAVGWFMGVVQEAQAGRFSADLSVDDALALLGNQQMPRQLYGVGCWHQVYDAGCTLLKSSFTTSAHVTAVTDGAHFQTSLTQADDFFDLGVITFTSGVNSGLSAKVNHYLNASGAIVAQYPFPTPPAISDTFSIYPGCDLQQATCTTKFSNLAHFGGMPYVPDPSTIVDGETSAPPHQPKGSQAGVIVSSAPSAQQTYGTFTT